MRILAIHRYYWPDVAPYGVMLKALAAHWASQGHSVSVSTAVPSYGAGKAKRTSVCESSHEGVAVRRIRIGSDQRSAFSRLVNAIAFSVITAGQVALGRRRDLVMCSTVPQVLLAYMVSLACRLRRTRFLYHCMDLHPEIGAISGEFAAPWRYRFLMRLEKATCRRAWAIVVLSEDMRLTLIQRDQRLAAKIHVIENFDLPPDVDQSDIAKPMPRPSPGVIRICFTGNLGRFQGLEQVVDVVLRGPAELDALELVLMGDGAVADALRKRWRHAPVGVRSRLRFLPHSPRGEALALMRSSDYGLVSLVPGVIRFAHPSKAATYLAQGLPLLVAVEEDSELVRSVLHNGTGRHLPHEEGEMLATLLDLTRLGPVSEAFRNKALEYWSDHLEFGRVLVAWEELLTTAGGKS